MTVDLTVSPVLRGIAVGALSGVDWCSWYSGRKPFITGLPIEMDVMVHTTIPPMMSESDREFARESLDMAEESLNIMVTPYGASTADLGRLQWILCEESDVPSAARTVIQHLAAEFSSAAIRMAIVHSLIRMDANKESFKTAFSPYAGLLKLVAARMKWALLESGVDFAPHAPDGK